MTASATAPNPVAQDVGRIPQTTAQLPAGGPFVRYSPGDCELASPIDKTGQNFGARITDTLTAVSGFMSGLLLKVFATGGTSAGAVVKTADSPWAIIHSFSFRDSSGQPLYADIDGFSLFLINLYSGLCGQGGRQDPRTLPSFSDVQLTSGAGAGNFQFALFIPFQMNSSGYGSLPGDNSAEQPKVTMVLGVSADIYSTPPTTTPLFEVRIDQVFNAVPSNYPNLEPFDVGASHQIDLESSAQNPPNGQAKRVKDAGVGQFVMYKIYVLRDSTGARLDSFPASDITLWIDNYPYKQETFLDRQDKMAKAFGVGATSAGLQARPTGVVAYTWRQSNMQEVSDADDMEDVLVTTGSTKVELGGTWGTLSNQPAVLTSITGMCFPGPSGWPYGSQAVLPEAA